MKALLTGLLFTGCAACSYAYPVGFPGDTTRKEKPLYVLQHSMPVVVLQQANVVFPSNLAGHEEASLDYIEKFSERRRDYLLRMYNQGKKFFPKVQKIFKKYEVPDEFRVLLALESGFNAQAVSPAGAVGYWQIMDVVAREYGMSIAAREKAAKANVRSKKGRGKKQPVMARILHKGKQSDDRTNFMKSTLVAARYLKDRCRNLNNDWLLIAASYNCGVGNVWNAMERSGKPNPTFWDIRDMLPAETRAYVMNFITLNVIFHNFDAFAKNQLCFRDVICLDDSAGDCAEEMPADLGISAID